MAGADGEGGQGVFHVLDAEKGGGLARRKYILPTSVRAEPEKAATY